ncbi:ORF6N domain-containing protein [Serratia odorifera]|uniref:ORF6N domain-containing protein n=1 Tax=Serratia odorifera TaxID=618 RepID=UPI003D2D0AC5
MNTITIQDTQLPVVEFRDQRVVTYEMIDEVHGRPAGTAKDAYQRNKCRFVENEDTYLIEYSEKNVLRSDYITVPSRGIRVFTETGYLMLIKVFGDDLSWQAQRELVRSYFRRRQQQPKTQAEIIAEMALLNVEQERRLNHVEDRVEAVTETIEQIKRGTIPAGWAGYSLLRTKSGLTDTKCRALVKGYNIPTDTITIMTPDGQPRPMKIVLESAFMSTFRQMMTEAEPRGVRWYHPLMGLFQVIGWESGSCR